MGDEKAEDAAVEMFIARWSLPSGAERAEEEKTGLVSWPRLGYQIPLFAKDAVNADLETPVDAEKAPAWHGKSHGQIEAVCDELVRVDAPVSSINVSKVFQGGSYLKEKDSELLESLVMLGQGQKTGEYNLLADRG